MPQYVGSPIRPADAALAKPWIAKCREVLHNTIQGSSTYRHERQMNALEKVVNNSEVGS